MERDAKERIAGDQDAVALPPERVVPGGMATRGDRDEPAADLLAVAQCAGPQRAVAHDRPLHGNRELPQANRGRDPGGEISQIRGAAHHLTSVIGAELAHRSRVIDVRMSERDPFDRLPREHASESTVTLRHARIHEDRFVDEVGVEPKAGRELQEHHAVGHGLHGRSVLLVRPSGAPVHYGGPVAGLKSTYLLHGDDHGKLAERRANLRTLAGKLGAELEFLEGDRATPAAAAASLAMLTLTGDRRVVIVDDVQRWKDRDVEADLLPALAHIDDLTTIAFFAREEKSKTVPASLRAAVESSGGDVVHVALPEERDLSGWVVREAAAAGIELDREAADLIATRVGRRPSRLARVLEVVALGAAAPGRLGAPDVAPFVGDDAELVAWPLVDALVAGQEQHALRLMLELVERGESPVRLLAMVERRARELRDLALRLASGESRQQVEASIKGPPWARGKRVQEAQRADRLWLDTLVTRLATLEVDTRGGSAADPAVRVIHQLFRPPVAARS